MSTFHCFTGYLPHECTVKSNQTKLNPIISKLFERANESGKAVLYVFKAIVLVMRLETLENIATEY